MTLASGTRLGPYEILSPLGAGGMGEVYKAKDTRLGRDVAVKVLPSHLSDSPDLKARFEREAKAISQLTHPHICTLYDVGHQDGIDFLVMELLDGESLADRLDKGLIPAPQVIAFGIEIAEGLEKAHRSGIVHRDLKPGNIMLTKSGVKLLDFGLAKTAVAPATSADVTSLPTEGIPSQPLTEKGTVMGTFQYMAPEQIEGAEADARTDIFAFGCVLYEMATGKKAFTGKSRMSLIGAILKDEPPAISTVSPMTPPALDRLVQTCLAKEADDRFQTAHDVKLQLKWIAEGGSQAGAPAVVVARRKSREKLAWGISGLLFLAAALLAIGYVRRAPIPPAVLRATLDLPPGARLDSKNTALALSPDGSRLAMALRGSDQKQQLWVRPLDSLTSQPLSETEGATYPFWSPDGLSIGFFAEGKLKRIDSSGGAVQTICDAADGRGASWNRDGVIVFAGGVYGGLSRVSAAGGTPAAVGPEANSSESHRLPSFLPDGRHLLYYTIRTKADESGVSILDLETGKSKELFRSASEAQFVPPGYLVFMKEKNLVAQRFDAGRLATTGEAVPIAESVQFNPLRATGNFAFAGDRLLVFETGAGGGKSRLTWISLDGKELGAAPGEPGNFAEMRVSRDGRLAAVGIPGLDGQEHLWTMDLESGVRTRFTLDDADSNNPIWSPDGRFVAYTQTGQKSRIVVKDSSGVAAPSVLFESANFLSTSDWSPDGRTILFSMQSPETKSMDIWEVETDGARKAKPLVAGPRNEQSPHLSPDGKWLAYRSDESGQSEVYVAKYPGPGGKWQVTSFGAGGLGWLSSQEIAYGGPQGFHAVTLTPHGSGLDIGAPRPILGGEPNKGPLSWDLASRRFLEAIPLGDQATPSLRIVTNWAKALNAK